MQMLSCSPLPIVRHADISGNQNYGGVGITATCHDGYDDNRVINETIACTSSGWARVSLNCTPTDPCSRAEDDCHALADCTHTGPGTHECECVGAFFGTYVQKQSACLFSRYSQTVG